MEIDKITHEIIGAAMHVHTALGPGLLESVYETCLKHELTKHGFKVESQLWLPVRYDGIKMESGYKIDLLVEGMEQILAIHKAQTLSYLKLGGYPVGLLINFNVVHLRDGIKRFINQPKVPPCPLRPSVVI